MPFKEAIDYLGISKSSLYKMTSNNSIRYFKPNGGKIYFQISDLDAYMLSNMKKSKSEVQEEMLTKIKDNG